MRCFGQPCAPQRSPCPGLLHAQALANHSMIGSPIKPLNGKPPSPRRLFFLEASRGCPQPLSGGWGGPDALFVFFFFFARGSFVPYSVARTQAREPIFRAREEQKNRCCQSSPPPTTARARGRLRPEGVAEGGAPPPPPARRAPGASSVAARRARGGAPAETAPRPPPRASSRLISRSQGSQGARSKAPRFPSPAVPRHAVQKARGGRRRARARPFSRPRG